jgi:4-aminobutyrate--pyruvate transaminase
MLTTLTKHPLVGHASGIGLIGGIELVQDKETKARWPAEVKLGSRIDAHARREGLILRIVGDRIAFSPPLIITADEVGELSRRLHATLDGVLEELRAL